MMSFSSALQELTMADKSTFNAPRPPTFDGYTRDILKVENSPIKMEQHLKSCNVLKPAADGHQTNIKANKAVSAHVTDNTLPWLTSLKMRDFDAPIYWDNFKAKMSDRYIPEDAHNNPVSRLHLLRQTKSARHYNQEFTTLCLKVCQDRAHQA
ncbi:hypothetical protein HDV00_005288 [Rhizophlyctis rosea]|nr:hypothetical protein HDV00_005288 [Rhizophlyctis rosea]